MKFKLGDIVRIDEPESIQPEYWNRSFKIIDIESVYTDEPHPWLVVEVIGEPILYRRRRRGRVMAGRLPQYELMKITRFEITEDGQKDLILIKRGDELIPKDIKKHKI